MKEDAPSLKKKGQKNLGKKKEKADLEATRCLFDAQAAAVRMLFQR